MLRNNKQSLSFCKYENRLYPPHFHRSIIFTQAQYHYLPRAVQKGTDSQKQHHRSTPTHTLLPVFEIFTCFLVGLLKSKHSTGNIIGISV